MDWYRRYTGTTCDPKWLPIARACNCPAGLVSNVWDALMEHASQQRPRGSIADWDAEAYAVFSGFDLATVTEVTQQFETRRLIVDGKLRRWTVRQGDKVDNTAAERQQRARERKKGKGSEPVTPSHGVTGDDASRPVTGVTPLERKKERKREITPDYVSTPALEDSSSTNITLDARALDMDTAKAMLKSCGAFGNAARWFMDRGKVDQVIASGCTVAQFASAIESAKEVRSEEGTGQAVNVGLIVSLVAADRAATRVRTRPPSAQPSRAGGSPEVPNDPLRNAIDFARNLLRLGQIDQAECDRRIAEAQQRHGATA